MIELFASIGLGVAGAISIAMAFRFVGAAIEWRPFITAMLSVLIYWAIVVAGAEVQTFVSLADGLRWNWVGKLFSALLLIGLIALTPRDVRQEIGFRWRQEPGSAGPAMLCALLICAFAWAFEWWSADGIDTSLERLAFQAIMPGLDEEIFFRGIFLALLARAFTARWNFLGASVDPSAAILTFVFAAGHGLGFEGTALRFDAEAFIATGMIGAGILWIRLRTGSLLLPILVHNAVNFGNSFW